LTRHILILAILICLFATFGCVATRTEIQMPPQKAKEVEFEVMKELEMLRGKVRKDVRVTAGGFYDKTGQHKDATRTRYSKAVTQGSEEMLYHMLYKALGPRAVLDRQVDSWNRLTSEYQYSWVSPAGKSRHAGIIKHGGPTGWLVGADYLVTGAVVYFNEDRYSGGGGVNIDGVGANYKKVFSRVGIELRLVDMNTSEICWSTIEESWVSGTLIGVDLFRFMTAWGDEYLVSGEAGVAEYLPSDYALQVCMASAVVDMIKENEAIFIAGRGARQEEARESTKENKQIKEPGMAGEKKEAQQPAAGREQVEKQTGEEQQPKESGMAGEKKEAQQPAAEEKQTKKPQWLKPPGAVQGW
jgi:curli biogenesis system outer membrane secretion channel CsgG